MDHAVGGQALDRMDRLTVDSEFGVVIVLDDESFGSMCPTEECRPAPRRQCHAQGVLVSGGDKDRVGPFKGVDHDPFVVNRDGTDLQSSPREDLTEVRKTGVFHGHLDRSDPNQCNADGGQALRDSATYNHLVGDDPTRPG
jgi:hypothetical protein